MHVQVRDVMREGGSAGSAPHTAGLRLMSSGREVMPALGPSWASCVDVRLFLSRPEIRDAPVPSDPNLVWLCKHFLLAIPCQMHRLFQLLNVTLNALRVSLIPGVRVCRRWDNIALSQC